MNGPPQPGSDTAIGPLRWHLKKLARTGVALASAAVQRPGAAGDNDRIRVLTYHRFGDVPRDPFCVTPSAFREQMGILADGGLAVSLADVQSFLEGRTSLEDGAVLVSIDDGHRSLATDAAPILREFGIPAVAFVTASEIDPAGPRAAGSWADLRVTRQDLETMMLGGVAIGSHAWTHRSMGCLSPAEALEEAQRSRTSLRRWFDQPVEAFAYPFGTRSDFNRQTTSILADCGYTCAFTSQHGALTHDSDPLLLPRIKVESGEGGRMFRRILRGGLDAWRFVDRTLWRLQSAERGT